MVALGFTYLGLWLLSYGLVHKPQLENLPLDVVLEAPPPQMAPHAPMIPPQAAKKVPPPIAPRKLLTQEPVATPTEAAVPAPPLEAPPSPLRDAASSLESPPVEIATETVAPTPPRLETVPVSRLTHTPAFAQKQLPEDPKGVSIPLDGVRVVARITLDETATVRDVEIVKSGGAAFDAAVIVAIRRSRFTPGYVGDHPVAVAFNQTYRFQLQ